MRAALRFDGVDLRQNGIAALRRAITVLFQQPVHYQATVAENIQLGQLGQSETPEERWNRSRDSRCRRRSRRDGGHQSFARWLTRCLGKWFFARRGTERVVNAAAGTGRGRFARSAPIVLAGRTDQFDGFRGAEGGLAAAISRAMTGRYGDHHYTFVSQTRLQADRIHSMNEGKSSRSGTPRRMLALGGLIR